jgi:hypothetical protein
MKFKELKQAMDWRRRVGFNGGGYVKKRVLPKKKPEEEVKKRKLENFEKAKPALENPKEVKEMIDKPKRGLVDEPGSYSGDLGQKYLYKHKDSGYRVMATKGDEKIYKTFPKNKLKEAIAYAKEIEEKFDKIEAKPPREVTGKKLTVYNKFAQDIHGKNYDDLTKAEKNIVQTRYRQSGGKFRKTFQTDELTDLNKERIKKAFPDVEFEFTKGKKYGVVQTLKNGKRNPVFTAVNNFVNNDYKLSVRKALPVSTQRDIVANFELPKGVKEWNFDVNKGGNLYGIPDTAGANMNLGARIKNFVNEPKPYKIAADFGTPEGWLLSQMNRAFESKQNPNFIPKYDLINNKKKIVGFTDNQYGGGKTYYALKKYANKFNGTMMTEHPDFKNTKKYIDIANNVKLAPNKIIKDLLIKGGVTDDRITLNNLLQYMVNEKGVEPTKRGLVLHHKGGAFANPTRDFQILNTAVNQNIKGVELAMRSNPANITPKNIKFLKDAGASITIDGKTYGGGPKTAIGGFKQTEQFVQEKLKGFTNKDFQQLNKYLNTIGVKATDTTANAASKIKNAPLPPKIKNVLLGVIGLGGGSLVGDLFRPVQADEPGAKEATSVLPTAAGAGAGAAAVGTKTGRNILGRTISGAFGPTGLFLLGAGTGGYDLTNPLGRATLAAEAAFAPDFVRGTIGATKGMKNRALQKVAQRALNLTLSVPQALRVARIASPLGIAALGGEALYGYGKFVKSELDRIKEMTPEEREQYNAAEQEQMGIAAAGGGLLKQAGDRSGKPPEAGPTPQGLAFLKNNVKKL